MTSRRHKRRNDARGADARETVVFGVQPVREALRAGFEITTIFMARSNRGATQQVSEEAAERGVRIEVVDRALLDRKAKTPKHQGILAVVRGAANPTATVEDMLRIAAERDEPPLILLLDQIQDPHNLGALIRSAHALGAHGVVIPNRRAAPITPTVVKAAAGATAHLAIASVTNLKSAIDTLQAEGVWCAAATLEGKTVEKCRLDGPLAFVIGSEGKGVRPSVAARCDLQVKIGLARSFDSLNASVAGAILLHEAIRQRRENNRE